MISKLLVNPGDTVLTEEYCYQGAMNRFRKLGAKLVGMKLDGDGIVIDALADATGGAEGAGHHAEVHLYHPDDPEPDRQHPAARPPSRADRARAGIQRRDLRRRVLRRSAVGRDRGAARRFTRSILAALSTSVRFPSLSPPRCALAT